MNRLKGKLGRRGGPGNNNSAERDRIFGSAGPGGQDRSDRRDDTVGQDRFDRRDETAGHGRFDRHDETAGRGRFDRDDDDDGRRRGGGLRGGGLRGGGRRGGGSGGAGARIAIARAITAIAGIIAVLIVVGILLVVLKANPANDIVDALRETARFFAQPFDAIFELERRRREIALNWGIAAVVYLVVGRLIAKLLTR